MDLSTFRLLLLPPGQDLLQEVMALEPREADFLRHFQGLARRHDPDLARAALETAILRREATSKFPDAERLYFTRQALEQAAATEVAAYRSARFRGCQRIVDLGCSVGGDTLAFVEMAPTLGVDLDPLRLAMAQANLQARGPSRDFAFLQADLRDALPLTSHPEMGLFFDPARRLGGRRLFSVRDYLPHLHVIRSWLPRFSALGVKLSPGVDLSELAEYDAEIEFVSLRGNLKESVLWFGPLKTTSWRATVLPGPHTLTPVSDVGEHQRLSLSIQEPQAFLYEPDPAVLRAGLVQDLGAQLGAAQLDPDIAYLTAEKKISTPYARVWDVEAWFPFGLKRLRVYLREHRVGQVVVKKRGSPLNPEELIRQLRLKGDRARVIFLTHLRGKPIVVVGVER